MSEEVQIVKSMPAALQAQGRELVLSFAMDLEVALSRMKQFQEFVAHYLQPSTDGGQDGGDYGAIPGAGKKKVLFKSGGDKLAELYALYDEYEIEAQENFDTKLFYYKVKCILKSRRDDSVVGTGLGSCSTYESKYRWRDSQRACPQCKAQAIIKGKDEFGGGWLCWTKKGGCGGKFKDGDQSIEGQVIGRVENPDIMDTVNTVLKMAKKRAKLDAVIGVTRSSGIFTQDLEDLPMPPPKPAVERTTEETAIPPRQTNSGPAQSGDGEGKEAMAAPSQSRSNVGGQIAGREVHQASGEAAGSGGAIPPSAAPAPTRTAFDPDAPIDKTRQVALHKAFREAIPNEAARTHADKFLQDILKHKGYVGADGAGTTKTISMGMFDEVKRECVEFAAGLK